MKGWWVEVFKDDEVEVCGCATCVLHEGACDVEVDGGCGRRVKLVSFV